MSTTIRPARDDDAAAIVAIVSGCWDEYPGCVTDIDGEAPELRALATHMSDRRGAAWVAEADGAVAGLVAVWPVDATTWEVGKMYVAAAHRGAGADGVGAAGALLDAAEAHARTRGAATMRLFSDTRFLRAHAFYEKHSYVRHGPVRALGDKSRSIEFGYIKPLTGLVVRTLDVAAIGAAKGRLASILCACVNSGAAVSFLPPLAPETGRAFWHVAGTAVATGKRIVLGAWVDGSLDGTVSLILDTPPNQPHRAEIDKLLVHPDVRRHGVARALMARAEAAALAAGRTLLTLETRAGDAAEPLYRAVHYTEGGRIPGYSVGADGTRCDSLFFYKVLPRE